MNEPVQELYLAPDLYYQVLNGEKLATCRTDYRPIKCGPVKLVNVDTPDETVMVDAHTVKWTSFDRLTEEDISSEAPSHNALFDSMVRFYPDFGWYDHVTFIAWSDPNE